MVVVEWSGEQHVDGAEWAGTEHAGVLGRRSEAREGKADWGELFEFQSSACHLRLSSLSPPTLLL